MNQIIYTKNSIIIYQSIHFVNVLMISIKSNQKKLIILAVYYQDLNELENYLIYHSMQIIL